MIERLGSRTEQSPEVIELDEATLLALEAMMTELAQMYQRREGSNRHEVSLLLEALSALGIDPRSVSSEQFTELSDIDEILARQYLPDDESYDDTED